MTSLAELVGGIGVDVMVFRHALEKELEAVGKLLHSGTQQLDTMQKNFASNDFAKTVIERISMRVAEHLNNSRLTKGTTSPAAIGELVGARVAAEIMTELHFPEIEERLRRAREQLPAYEAWLHGKPYPATQPTSRPPHDYGRFAVASKTVGQERGAELSELLMPSQKPTIDLDAGAVDAHLRHRRYQGD